MDGATVSPTRIDHPQVWRKVFTFMEPYAIRSRDGWAQSIGWSLYESETGLRIDASRAAYRRALTELESVYGVVLLSQDQKGFTIGRRAV